MNERIKELANKAGVDAGQMIANIICGDDEFKALGNEFNKLSQETREYIYKVIEQNQEKFAELIVRECADVLVENGDKQFNIRTVEPESHTKTTDWMEGYEEAVKHYGSFLLKKNAKLIKKHFGVE